MVKFIVLILLYYGCGGDGSRGAVVGLPVATEQERMISRRRGRQTCRGERAIPRDIARSGRLGTPMDAGRPGANVLTDAFPAMFDLGVLLIAPGCVGGR